MHKKNHLHLTRFRSEKAAPAHPMNGSETMTPEPRPQPNDHSPLFQEADLVRGNSPHVDRQRLPVQAKALLKLRGAAPPQMFIFTASAPLSRRNRTRCPCRRPDLPMSTRRPRRWTTTMQSSKKATPSNW